MTKPRLGVAMIGHGFMGAAHSQGWRVAPRFFDLGAEPVMQVIVGRDADAVAGAAQRWGWAESATDWREVMSRDDIQIVDIVTPGDSHAQLAIAALDAGKHVLCEKPLANTVEEAEAMAAAADRALKDGVFAMLGHTYRRVSAVTFARDLVRAGKVGEIRQVRASYLQDWLADPAAPLSWRLQKDRAGSGALGDIGAHIIDLVQFVTGERLEAVSGRIETVIRERPVLAQRDGIAGRAGTEFGEVTVDDAALFLGRFESGVLGSFEATRLATGRKNALRIEVSGSTGAIAFDLEDMNAVQLYDRTAPDTEQGFTRIQVTEPGHPYLSAWWPSGHIIGYEHSFSHQVKDFVDAVTAGTQPEPTFRDGVQIQRALAAVERSSADNSAWTPL